MEIKNKKRKKDKMWLIAIIRKSAYRPIEVIGPFKTFMDAKNRTEDYTLCDDIEKMEVVPLNSDTFKTDAVTVKVKYNINYVKLAEEFIDNFSQSIESYGCCPEEMVADWTDCLQAQPGYSELNGGRLYDVVNVLLKERRTE